MKKLHHRYFYKKLKIKLQLKNLDYGRLFSLHKNKIIISIEDSILIVLKAEKLSLINKYDFLI
jgi:hypothetical protein